MIHGRELVEGPDFTPFVLRHVEEPLKLNTEVTCKNAVSAAQTGGTCAGGDEQLAPDAPAAKGSSQPWTTGVILQPAGSSEEFQFRRLQYRELTPEDYDLLCLLDESVPNKSIAAPGTVTSLPRIAASECKADDCHVCLGRLDPSSCVVPLPCGHVFHSDCISKWLTQCKGTCPLCNSVLDSSKASPRTNEKNILELDASTDLEVDAIIAVTKLARASIGRFGQLATCSNPPVIEPDVGDDKPAE